MSGEQQELDVRQIRQHAKEGSAVGDVESVFVEAADIFPDKIVRWIRDRVVPIVEELEHDANVMADMLLDEDKDDLDE